MPGALLIAFGQRIEPSENQRHSQAIRSGMLAAEHLAETGSPVGFDARLARIARGQG